MLDTTATVDTEDTPQHGRGATGNERLTAITGAVLLVLFAAEGVTLLELRGLLYWHYFIGLLLIGPVCVKIGTTGYRFARYYGGAPEYVRKGPPITPLRILGPFVVLTTVGVVATGVALGLVKSRSYDGIPLLFLHKASFVCWVAVMSIHVLAYLWRLPALIGADLRTTPVGRATAAVGGRGLRWSLTAAALTAGLILALAAGHLSTAWHH